MYLKGLQVKIFRVDAPYGCISLFIRQSMKKPTILPFSVIYSKVEATGRNVKRVPFFDKKFIKGVPFLPKWHMKG